MGDPITGAIAGGVVNSVLNRGSRKKAGQIAGMILPENIRTGRSSYNTKSGVLKMDPSIRQGQNNVIKALRDRKRDVNRDFRATENDLMGIRDDIRGVRADYESNSGAFMESMLNPLRSEIARGRGELERSMSRRGMAGSSFANQQMTNFNVDSGRALTDATAQLENQRINTLGDFIGMDADIIKEGIRSREGRTRLMAELDQIIGGRFDQQFAQEMDMLSLPGQFTGATSEQAKIRANAAGIEREQLIKTAGDIISAIPSGGGGTGAGGSQMFDYTTMSNYGG